MTTTTDWRNLIVAHEPANPLELKAHPLNFYTHPLAQRKVVNAAIDDIGYIDEVVANRRTGRVLNGHLRVELAIGNGESQIPVTWVDCDEATENQILLFFDRIGEQAKVQGDKVSALADLVAPNDLGLQNMLDEWVASFEKFSRSKPAAPAPVVAPAPVAAAAAPVPVAAATTAAPAPIAAPAPVTAVPTPASAPSLEADPVAQAAQEPAEPAQEAPAAPVAPAAVEAAPEPAQEAPAAPVAANNFEAAIIEDTGEAIAPPPVPVAAPASRAAKVEKPPVVMVKVGEYAQELPAELFNAWWATFRTEVGDDYHTIVAEVRQRLQIPDDPR